MRSIDLKVNEYKKYKEEKQWFKDVANFYMPAWNRSSIEEYDEMLASYEFINNDLSRFEDELMRRCNPLHELGMIEDKMIAYNQIPNKIAVLKGEMLKRGNSFKLVLLSAQAIKRKDEKMLAAIKASVDERVALKIQQVQMQLQGKSEEEIQEYIDKMTEYEEPEDLAKMDFKSNSEIMYNRLLQYTYFDQDILTKKLGTFEDTLVVDRCFTYCGFKNGKPYIKVCNPLNIGYHKSPNEMFIQKGDFVWHRESVTLQDILTEYGNKLTEEQLRKLGIYTRSPNRWDNSHNVLQGSAEPLYDHTSQEAMLATQKGYMYWDLGLHQGGEMSGNYMFHEKTWKVHLEFKAYKQVIFLSYRDEYGKPITTIVDANFIKGIEGAKRVSFTNRFGDESSKLVWTDIDDVTYEAEELWIPRRYEVTRLGDSIYVDEREVPNQPLIIENPFSSFELSYKGAVFTARNAKPISPVRRAMPSQFTYLFVAQLRNQEIAKYEGMIQNIDTDQIPDDLGKDKEGEQILGIDAVTAHQIIQRKTGKNYYSGSQSSLGGLPPATRSPGSSSFLKGSIN